MNSSKPIWSRAYFALISYLKKSVKNPIKKPIVARLFFLGTATALLTLSFQNCGKFSAKSASELSASSLAPTTTESNSDPNPADAFSVPTLSLATAVKSLSNSRNLNLQLVLNTDHRTTVTSVTCQLDGAAKVDCSSLSFNSAGLVDGDHSLRVEARDSTGQTATPLIISFRIDATAPIVQVSKTPPGIVGSGSVQFIFSALDNLSGIERVECSLDASTYVACASPYNLNVSTGSHVVKIRAFDNTSNVSSEFSYSWIIDPSAPTLALSQQPSLFTNTSVANFSFSSSKSSSSFQCQPDTNPYAACTSSISYSNLSEGPHTFRFKATDNLGNTSSELSYNWTVDLSAPILQPISSNMASVLNNAALFTKQTQVQFYFSAADNLSGIAKYICWTDQNPPADCTSPFNSTFNEGLHSFNVKAVDKAGNTSAVSQQSWTLDLTPPITPGQLSLSGNLLSWTASTDTGSGLNGYIVFISYQPDSAALSSNTIGNVTNSVIDFTGLTSGLQYYVNLQAKDLVGNVSQRQSMGFSLPIISEPPPATLLYKDISADLDRQCVVLNDGTVDCWNLRSANPTPTKVAGISNVRQISLGYQYICAVTNDNNAYCWGSNNHGQLGLGYFGNGGTTFDTRTNYVETPTKLPSTGYYKKIYAEFSRTCAITIIDTVQCWGERALVFPNQNNEDSANPITVQGANGVLTGVKDLSVNIASTCALVSGKVFCWSVYTPTNINEVTGLSSVSALTGHGEHHCALLSDKTVKCWGRNQYGQLGDGTTTSSAAAVSVIGLTDAAQIFSSNISTCVLTSGGAIKCWGVLPPSKFINGLYVYANTPVAVDATNTYSKISIGGSALCGILKSGAVNCLQ